VGGAGEGGRGGVVEPAASGRVSTISRAPPALDAGEIGEAFMLTLTSSTGSSRRSGRLVHPQARLRRG